MGAEGVVADGAGARGGVSTWSILTRPIVLACLVQLAEALATNVIWPFAPFLVERYGHGGDEVGTYYGIFASSFFALQFVSSVPWGRVSDRFGRRPGLIWGTLGGTFAILGLGFSRSYWWAVLFRSLSGLLNGNVGITKSYMSEVTTKETRARAFSLLSFNWGVGSILGPMLGGYLADPVSQFGWSGPWAAPFETFPYLLPCLIAALYSAAVTVALIAGLPESPKWLENRERESEEGVEDDSSLSWWCSGHLHCCTRWAAEPAPAPVRPAPRARESRGSRESRGMLGGAAILPSRRPVPSIASSIEASGDETDLIELVARPSKAGKAGKSGSKPRSPLSSTASSSYSSSSASSKPSRSLSSTRNSSSPAASSASSASSASPSSGLPGPRELCSILGERKPRPSGSFDVLRCREVLLSIALYGLIALATVLYDEMLPLFAKHPVEEGGLGFDKTRVGNCLTIQGVFLVIYQLFFFARIADALGVLRLFRYSALGAMVYFATFPMLNLAALSGLPALEWGFISLSMLIKNVVLANVFSAVFIMMNNAAGGRDLGRVNGIGQSVAALVRTLGPTAGGGLFSLTVHWEAFPLRLYVNYFLMGAIMFYSFRVALSLPDWVDYAVDDKMGAAASGGDGGSGSGSGSKRGRTVEEDGVLFDDDEEEEDEEEYVVGEGGRAYEAGVPGGDDEGDEDEEELGGGGGRRKDAVEIELGLSDDDEDEDEEGKEAKGMEVAVEIAPPRRSRE